MKHLIAIVTSLALSAGCAAFGRLDPKAQRAVDTFECYVRVLEPYVGEVMDTEELVRGVIRGSVPVRRALMLLGATELELQQINAELQACMPQPVTQQPEQVRA